jgi:hypoxanthine phosphoribosyltransferase
MSDQAAPLRLSRLYREEEIAHMVARLGREISARHPDGVVLVGLLKDSAIFLADLLRAIEVPCIVDFVALSAYTSGERRVRVMKDLDADLTGGEVVLVRDIVDTGLSVGYVLDMLRARGAGSVELCALLDRSARRILPVPVDYVGARCGDEFLVGYGLDFDERYRNLRDIYQLDAVALAEQRELADDLLYGHGGTTRARPGGAQPARE